MLQVKATTCKVIKGIFTFSDQKIYTDQCIVIITGEKILKKKKLRR